MKNTTQEVRAIEAENDETTKEEAIETLMKSVTNFGSRCYDEGRKDGLKTGILLGAVGSLVVCVAVKYFMR